MQDHERPQFTQALHNMSVMFDHPLSETRQSMYWALLRDRVTLDEWTYATAEAMARETFYKVPLPAHLLDYVREYRHLHEETT